MIVVIEEIMLVIGKSFEYRFHEPQDGEYEECCDRGDHRKVIVAES